MKPIYLQVDDKLQLMIIPDSDAHVDGHPVLTYSYAIYKREQQRFDNEFIDTSRLLTPDKRNNPNYLGTLTFEYPGKLFTYAADGPGALSSAGVQELIEQLTHFRENPSLWSV